MRGTKIDICTDCGADISHRGNRSYRCESCQRDFNNKNRKEVRRTVLGFPRFCGQCGVDISERNPIAVICWGCRKKNRAILDHGYYLRRKKERFNKRRYRKWLDRQLFEVKLPGNLIVTIYPGKKYGGVLGRKLIEQNPSRMTSARDTILINR